MNRVIRFLQAYLLIGFPFVVINIIWQCIYFEHRTLQGAGLFTRFAYEIFSWNLMLWFVALITFLILLVCVARVREKTLRRLANLRERDEREEYITGKASRTAYLSTLSLMIFFLFFSVFSVNIYRVPANQAINGKRVNMAISLTTTLFDRAQVKSNPPVDVIFDSKSFSLSTSVIMLILLGWQLLIFNLASRKEQANILP